MAVSNQSEVTRIAPEPMACANALGTGSKRKDRGVRGNLVNVEGGTESFRRLDPAIRQSQTAYGRPGRGRVASGPVIVWGQVPLPRSSPINKWTVPRWPPSVVARARAAAPLPISPPRPTPLWFSPGGRACARPQGLRRGRPSGHAQWFDPC